MFRLFQITLAVTLSLIADTKTDIILNFFKSRWHNDIILADTKIIQFSTIPNQVDTMTLLLQIRGPPSDFPVAGLLWGSCLHPIPMRVKNIQQWSLIHVELIDTWVLWGVVSLDDFLGDLLLKSWAGPCYIHTSLDLEKNKALRIFKLESLFLLFYQLLLKTTPKPDRPAAISQASLVVTQPDGVYHCHS